MIDSFRDKTRELERSQEESKADLENKGKEIVELRSRCQELKGVLESKSKEIEELKSEVRNSKEKERSLEQKLHEKSAENEAQKREIAASSERCHSLDDAVKQKLKEIEGLNEKLGNARSSVVSLEQRIEEERTQKEAAAKKIEDSNQNLQQLTSVLHAKTSEIEKLHAEIRAFKLEKESLEHKIEEIKADNEKKNRDIADSNGLCQDLKEKIEEKSKEIEKIRAELTSLNEIKKTLEMKQHELLNDLENSHKHREEKLSAIEIEKGNLEVSIKKREDFIENQLSIIESTLSQIALEKIESEDVYDLADSNFEHLEGNSAPFKNVRESVIRLKMKTLGLKKDLEERALKHQEHEKKLLNEKEEKTKTIHELENQNSRLRDDHEKQAEDLIKMNVLKEKAEEDGRNLSWEIESLKKNLDQEKNQKINEVNRLTEEINGNKKEIESFLRENKKLQEEQARLDEMINVLVKEKEKLLEFNEVCLRAKREASRKLKKLNEKIEQISFPQEGEKKEEEEEEIFKLEQRSASKESFDEINENSEEVPKTEQKEQKQENIDDLSVLISNENRSLEKGLACLEKIEQESKRFRELFEKSQKDLRDALSDLQETESTLKSTRSDLELARERLDKVCLEKDKIEREATEQLASFKEKEAEMKTESSKSMETLNLLEENIRQLEEAKSRTVEDFEADRKKKDAEINSLKEHIRELETEKQHFLDGSTETIKCLMKVSDRLGKNRPNLLHPRQILAHDNKEKSELEAKEEEAESKEEEAYYQEHEKPLENPRISQKMEELRERNSAGEGELGHKRTAVAVTLTLKTAIDKLARDSNTAVTGLLETQIKLKEKEALLIAAKGETENVRIQLKNTEEEYNKLELKLRDKSEELQKAIEERDQQRESLESRLKESLGELKNSNAENIAIQRKFDESVALSNELSLKLEQLKGKQEELNSEQEKLLAELNEKTVQISEMKKAYGALDGELNAKTVLIFDMKKAIDALDGESVRLKKLYEETTFNLETVEKDKSRLEQDLSKMRELIRQKEQEFKEKDGENEQRVIDLKEMISGLERDLYEKEQKFNRKSLTQEKKINALENDLKETKRRLEDVTAELSSTTDKFLEAVEKNSEQNQPCNEIEKIRDDNERRKLEELIQQKEAEIKVIEQKHTFQYITLVKENSEKDQKIEIEKEKIKYLQDGIGSMMASFDNYTGQLQKMMNDGFKRFDSVFRRVKENIQRVNSKVSEGDQGKNVLLIKYLEKLFSSFRDKTSYNKEEIELRSERSIEKLSFELKLPEIERSDHPKIYHEQAYRMCVFIARVVDNFKALICLIQFILGDLILKDGDDEAVAMEFKRQFEGFLQVYTNITDLMTHEMEANPVADENDKGNKEKLSKFFDLMEGISKVINDILEPMTKFSRDIVGEFKNSFSKKQERIKEELMVSEANRVKSYLKIKDDYMKAKKENKELKSLLDSIPLKESAALFQNPLNKE